MSGIYSVSLLDYTSFGGVQVLTDLVNEWYIFWMDANNVNKCKCPSNGHAVGAIDALLKGQLKADESNKSNLATRRKIDLPPMQGRAMPVRPCLQMSPTCSAI